MEHKIQIRQCDGWIYEVLCIYIKSISYRQRDWATGWYVWCNCMQHMLGKVILRKQLQLRLRFTNRLGEHHMEYVHSDLLWCWMVQSLLLYSMRMSNQTTFQHVANTKIGGILKCCWASLQVLPEYTLYISIPNVHGENVKEYVLSYIQSESKSSTNATKWRQIHW